MTTQTETVLTQRAQPNGVLLTQLKTVQWVKSVGVVQYGQTLVERRYRTVKSIPVVSWALASIEMIFTSALLFITTLPWPTFIVNLLNKVDTFVEGAFETVTNKVEWWYDSIMVRLIRLRDSIESFLDTILSIGVFVTYKAIDVLAAGAAVVIATTRAAISPFLWLGAVFGLTKIEATQPEQNHINQKTVTVSPSPSDCAPEERGEEPTSVTSSDYESDVSQVSESWTLKHTDKLGTSYNRVDMKAMAEGRLRAAMYKRVKGQLRLMRQNSICFSRGMKSYVRHLLEPCSAPGLAFFERVKASILLNLDKHNVTKLYDRALNRLKEHPRLYYWVQFQVAIVIYPLNFLAAMLPLNPKRKSRRSRSMRSESLRRRNQTVPPITQGTQPLGLIKSEEPVDQDEVFCEVETVIPSVSEDPLKDSNEYKDSALATSLDEETDSNEGINDLKEQTICETDEDEKHKNEKEIPIKEVNGDTENQTIPISYQNGSMSETEASQQPTKQTKKEIRNGVTSTKSVESIEEESETTNEKVKRKISFSLDS